MSRIVAVVFIQANLINVAPSQELPVVVQQQLENVSEQQLEGGDDSFAQQLLQFSKHQLRLQ